MNDFIEFETSTTKNSHYIWAEKYRPVKIADYIGNESFKAELNNIVSTGQLNHLMLYGNIPGTGKTTAAKLIVKSINCDYMYLNCSDTNSVDDVRNKIKSFASTTGFSDIKVIICDESDFLTTNAQAALRNIIETFSLNCRFIFTCNYLEKIIPPILSRCQVFEIVPPSKKEIAIHLKSILDKETVGYTADDIGYVVNSYYPDIRKILNFSQQYSTSGQLKLVKNNTVFNDAKTKILELIANYNNLSTFNDIRQLIANNRVKHYEELYQCLYDNVNIYAKDKETVIILVIAEYLYQSALVVNKEITFMACIAKILKELKQ
jgi:DNA polymerase III delta prime subunit